MKNAMTCRLLTGLFFLLLVPALSAKIPIDVKTSWTEKHGTQVVKQGVIAAIDASAWGETTEFGEDYSLWLQGLHRTKGGGDTIVLRLQLELRTPSFFRSGDHLASRTVEVRYAQSTLDSIATLRKVVGASEWEVRTGTINQLIAMVGDLIPFPHPMIRTVVVEAAQSIQRTPDDAEVLEGVLVGLKTLEVVDHILQELS